MVGHSVPPSFSITMKRRKFIRSGGILAASSLLDGCGLTHSSSSRDTVLDVLVSNPEYLNPFVQLWGLFEKEHPGVKISCFALNEDTEATFNAKIAGGYTPAITIAYGVDANNYQHYVNIGELDFPWFDRWDYDVKNTWSQLYGLPGPRTLDPIKGFALTWLYHEEIMEKTGMDPRREVQTWQDLKNFLNQGTRWARQTKEVDFFWDLGWNSFVILDWFMGMIPMAFADGSVQHQMDCWLGRANFNAKDSPFRHTFEFFREATEKGWLPENWWTREFETDMEGTFLSKKSTVLLMGPWAWDKTLAGDPGASILGFPSTPPAEKSMKWQQYITPPIINEGSCMYEKAKSLPEWDLIKEAFFWFHSPRIVRLRAGIVGSLFSYKFDEPLTVHSAQHEGVLKDIGGELWPQVEYINYPDSLDGRLAAEPYRKKGGRDPWDRLGGGYASTFIDCISGRISIQDALDVAQANWNRGYEGLPNDMST